MEYYQYNELPNTVKRYKYYTKSFQEWLINTAVKRGLECAKQLANQVGTNSQKQITIVEQNRLIDEITRTRMPLTDTSGLLDLGDAIRARKEVQYFHRLQGSADVNHDFFLHDVLEDARSKFSALSNLVPVIARAPKVKRQAIDRILVTTSSGKITNDDEDDDDHVMLPSDMGRSPMPTTGEQTHEGFEQVLRTKKRRVTTNHLTPQDIKVQEDYAIITLLYEVSRVRLFVRILRGRVTDKEITAAMGALVTDLVLAHVQQKVGAVIEEAGISNIEELEKRIRDIHSKATSGPDTVLNGWLPKTAVRNLLCIRAFELLRAHKVTKQQKVQGVELPSFPHKTFIGHFDVITKEQVQLPLWDKFTCDMLQRQQSPWLALGFRITLDMHMCMRDDLLKLSRDIIEQAMDLGEIVRMHINYEEATWNTEDRPEYMIASVSRIDEFLIPKLDAIFVWLNKMLETKESVNGPMTTSEFVTVHSTLGGLSMSYWLKQIQKLSIGRLQRVLTRFCHLYNAAKQVGGLVSDWKDLDFIIEMHGSQRIYVGDAPTDPTDFESHYLLCTGTPAKYMATDCKHKGRRVPKGIRQEKVGLMSQFPLDEKIHIFQTARDPEDR